MNYLVKFANYLEIKYSSDKFREIWDRSISTDSKDDPYYPKMLAQRAGRNADRGISDKMMGSGYPDFDSEELSQKLRGSEWEEYNHPDIKGPARGFKTKLPGKFGLIKIDDLPEDAKVILKDPKGVGELSAVFDLMQFANAKDKLQEAWAKADTDFTTAIVGPNKEGAEVLWTIFPGDPVRPSDLKTGEKYKDGDVISKFDAQTLGFDYAKVENMLSAIRLLEQK